MNRHVRVWVIIAGRASFTHVQTKRVGVIDENQANQKEPGAKGLLRSACPTASGAALRASEMCLYVVTQPTYRWEAETRGGRESPGQKVTIVRDVRSR